MPQFQGFFYASFEPVVKAYAAPLPLFGLVFQSPYGLKPALQVILALYKLDAQLLAAVFHVQESKPVFAVGVDIGIIEKAYKLFPRIFLFYSLQKIVAVHRTADMNQHCTSFLLQMF